MKRPDPIIDELHKVRENLGRRFGFDVRRIGEALRANQGKQGHRVGLVPLDEYPRKRRRSACCPTSACSWRFPFCKVVVSGGSGCASILLPPLVFAL